MISLWYRLGAILALVTGVNLTATAASTPGTQGFAAAFGGACLGIFTIMVLDAAER
jgi:hypothetical protein